MESEAGLLKDKAPEALRKDIREIINYREALYYAEFALKSRPITLSLIKEMHKILMRKVRGNSKSPGNFRTTQNWIGNFGSPIEDARVIPPNPLIVSEYMENLNDFLYEKFDDEIVRTAIIHAQFEIIHPFLDGNGRIGRLLIPLIFYSKKLISRPAFYISEYFETNRKLYYDKLLGITDSGDWQSWIEYFITAVKTQAEVNINRAVTIIDLYNNLKGKFVNITHSQFAIPVLDAFFQKPLVTSSAISKLANINNRVTLNKVLSALENGGVIVTVKKGKGRETSVYAMPELLNIVK
ncbi:MAG: Fic family protein [Caldisericaceae bacterium]|nr:Fic family protein [Caldisericaceae bacterium]